MLIVTHLSSLGSFVSCLAGLSELLELACKPLVSDADGSAGNKEGWHLARQSEEGQTGRCQERSILLRERPMENFWT